MRHGVPVFLNFLFPARFRFRADPTKNTALGLFLEDLFHLAIGQLLGPDRDPDFTSHPFQYLIALGIVAGVGQQGGDERRAAGCQRPSRGPDV